MKNLGQLVLGGLFLFIGNAQGNQLFQNPMINGYPLDLCKEWASNCGKPATDAFCKLKAFQKPLLIQLSMIVLPLELLMAVSFAICRNVTA